MKLNNLVIEELSRMKSLFGYERGKVISEQEQTTLPDVTVKNTLTPRQKNINNAFCAVKNGLIVNPSSSHNGTKWVDYVSTYKVTTAEIATSQKKCPNSEVATKTKAPVKPDPKVMELQKQIKAALPHFNLGTSGPNKDGIDGIMGPRTKEGQRQMIQQKGQQALNNMSQQGKNVQNQFNKTIQQGSVLTPEQQANAEALKAGQPLPQQQATQQPTQQNDVVTKEPPTEPGQAGEYKNGWYWDEKQQQWYQA